MAAPVWRVEIDRTAARDLRKLGVDAERRVLRYLRERIAGSDDPRRFVQPPGTYGRRSDEQAPPDSEAPPETRRE